MSTVFSFICAFCRASGLPPPISEYRFHPTRAWRLDFAWEPESWKVALEIQGATWVRGRHTRGLGYARDCEKLAEAQLAGWLCLWATTEQMQSELALAWVRRALESRGWKSEGT